MGISDWSSDVCSSDRDARQVARRKLAALYPRGARQGIVAPLGLVPVRPRLSRRLSRGVRDDLVLRSIGSTRARERHRGRRGNRGRGARGGCRSEEHTSELQSLMRISYAVFCLKKKKEHQKY